MQINVSKYNHVTNQIDIISQKGIIQLDGHPHLFVLPLKKSQPDHEQLYDVFIRHENKYYFLGGVNERRISTDCSMENILSRSKAVINNLGKELPYYPAFALTNNTHLFEQALSDWKALEAKKRLENELANKARLEAKAQEAENAYLAIVEKIKVNSPITGNELRSVLSRVNYKPHIRTLGTIYSNKVINFTAENVRYRGAITDQTVTNICNIYSEVQNLLADDKAA